MSIEKKYKSEVRNIVLIGGHSDGVRMVIPSDQKEIERPVHDGLPEEIAGDWGPRNVEIEVYTPTILRAANELIVIFKLGGMSNDEVIVKLLECYHPELPPDDLS